MARKTNVQHLENADPILVDMLGLQQLCGCGRFTAEKIAAAANAKIKIGRRTLYNAAKIKEYMFNVSEV